MAITAERLRTEARVIALAHAYQGITESHSVGRRLDIS